jgi:putative endonuclease
MSAQRGKVASHSESPSPAKPLAAGSTDTAAHFVYLILCADHTLYTGYTTNVERRLAAHNAGTGARYTRGRRPVTLVTTWHFTSKGEALRAERAIKSLSRAQKWRLAQEAGLESGIKDDLDNYAILSKFQDLPLSCREVGSRCL